MAAIERTDFSGGMVTDVSELKMPDNAVRNAQNVDLWSEKGLIKLFHSFLFKHAFPSSKRYDHHVTFPVQGDKDYAVIMMTDGTIYPYEPSGGFGSLLTTVTAGARMAYAGESVYVFYRAMSNPSLANTVRKRIYWDYDASAFVVENIFVDERITINSISEIGYGGAGPSNKDYTYKSVVTCVNQDGGESFGFERVATGNFGRDHIYKITKDADFSKLRLYASVIEDIGNNVGDLVSPGFIAEINSDGGFVPFVGINFETSSLVSQMRVYTVYASTNVEGALTFLLDQYVSSGNEYIAPGNKIKIGGVEFEIATIVYNVASAGVSEYYILTFVGSPTLPFVETLHNDADHFGVVEFEITWDTNVIYLPIQKRYYAIFGIPVDENRPQSKYTSGTGNVSVFASNKLFTANPYFPDVFSAGEDSDKKGFIGWNFITGEGKHAFSLIPDTQLISPTFTGSKIVDMFAFQDTLFILLDSGIARLKFENNNIYFLQSDKYGVTSRSKYFTDLGNMFIFSGGRLYSGAVDKLNYETGAFNFIELGRVISSLLESLIDPRVVYDNINEVIYISDLDDGTNYICSLRDGNPVWIKLNTGGTYFSSGFRLGNAFYFVNETVASDFISTNDTSVYGNDVVIEDKNSYLPMGRDYLRKIEVLYVKPSGTLTFTPILDDVALSGQSLPNKSNVGFYEIKLSRSGETRLNKFRWKLEGSSLTSAFKFLGVFVNRDVYTRETQKGY